jgi:hypothetical protein
MLGCFEICQDVLKDAYLVEYFPAKWFRGKTFIHDVGERRKINHRREISRLIKTSCTDVRHAERCFGAVHASGSNVSMSCALRSMHDASRKHTGAWLDAREGTQTRTQM